MAQQASAGAGKVSCTNPALDRTAGAVMGYRTICLTMLFAGAACPDPAGASGSGFGLVQAKTSSQKKSKTWQVTARLRCPRGSSYTASDCCPPAQNDSSVRSCGAGSHSCAVGALCHLVLRALPAQRGLDPVHRALFRASGEASVAASLKAHQGDLALLRSRYICHCSKVLYCSASSPFTSGWYRPHDDTFCDVQQLL